MTPEAGAYLWDARRAADAVARFIAGRDRDDYLGDDLLRSAVERQFEIVGEALAQLGKASPALLARLPDARNAIGFRKPGGHRRSAQSGRHRRLPPGGHPGQDDHRRTCGDRGRHRPRNGH